MIACLKKDLLKRSLWVQKDVKLDGTRASDVNICCGRVRNR